MRFFAILRWKHRVFSSHSLKRVPISKPSILGIGCSLKTAFILSHYFLEFFKGFLELVRAAQNIPRNILFILEEPVT